MGMQHNWKKDIQCVHIEFGISRNILIWPPSWCMFRWFGTSVVVPAVDNNTKTTCTSARAKPTFLVTYGVWMGGPNTNSDKSSDRFRGIRVEGVEKYDLWSSESSFPGVLWGRSKAFAHCGSINTCSYAGQHSISLGSSCPADCVHLLCWLIFGKGRCFHRAGLAPAQPCYRPVWLKCLQQESTWLLPLSSPRTYRINRKPLWEESRGQVR